MKLFLGCIILMVQIVSASAQTHYEHLIMYGQSLSTGHESGTTISAENIPGNYMIGDQVWMNCGNTNISFLNPLIGKPSACAPNDVIETPVLGIANHLQKKGVIPNIIATSAGQSGSSIEELSKESQVLKYYNTFYNTLTTAYTLTKRNEGLTLHCPAIFYLQGENNYGATGNGLTAGSTATSDKDEYKTLLITLKENMQTEAKKIYKQDDVPVFYVYQTGAQYTRGKELTIGMAQLEASNEYKDIVCAGPVYPMTDYGGHLDANGYRWYGEMMGKVYYKNKVSGEDFKPLQPKAVYRDASDKKKVTVQFLVPKLPLAFDEHILPKQIDYGFVLYNNGQRQGIKEFNIVDDCVEIYSSANLTGDIEIVYAGTVTQGHGNLRDSDDYQAVFNYVDIDEKDANDNYIYPRNGNKSLRPSNEPKDESGNVIYGKPYPLYNFSVAFYYKLLQEESRLDVNFDYPTDISVTDEEKEISVFFSANTLYVNTFLNAIKGIDVHALSGKKILDAGKNSYSSDSMQLDLSTLPQGIYIVRITTQNVTKSVKIVVD